MRRPSRGTNPVLAPGQIEYEFGIPIAGTIQPREAWTKTALKQMPAPGPLDWDALFPNSGPLVLDIGCGNGRYTLASALDRPTWNHLAIDPLPAVVRYGTRRANQRGLSNVRFAVIDGWRLLHDFTQDGTFEEIHIYHPQPYSDPKKASRRMLTPDFLHLLHRRLKPCGRVFLQTDRAAYWEYIAESFGSIFDWKDMGEEWPDGVVFRSRREILARKQGLTIYRGIATRRENWSEAELQQAIEAMHMPTFSIE